MTSTGNKVLKSVREHLAYLILGGLFVIVLLLIFYWAITPSNAPPWTGFSSSNEAVSSPRSKTLWDWLEVLILPTALLLAAWIIGKKSLETDAEAVEDHRLLNQKEIVKEGHQEKRLQIYFDRMSTLLLRYNLRASAEGTDVRHVARAQTLTTLWDLDTERKGALMRFLYEAELISQPNPVISLTGANLLGADLRGANLSEADLRQAHLIKANLSEADLDNTNFGGTNLAGADMRGALSSEEGPNGSKWVLPNLSHANLNEAVLTEADLAESDLSEASLNGTHLDKADLHNAILRGANLKNASLEEANLKGSNLKSANLREAKLKNAILDNARIVNGDLSQADLSGASLEQVNLKEANLSGANLKRAKLVRAYLYDTNMTGANLQGANFRGANLNGCDFNGADLEKTDLRGAFLTDAKLTREQLSKVYSTDGAILPEHLVNDSERDGG